MSAGQSRETNVVAGESYPGASLQPWQFRAGQFLFLIIFFRLPWFDVPCELGRCTNPLELLTVELYAYNRAPLALIKALLYPGTFLQEFSETISLEEPKVGFPDWDTLLDRYASVKIKGPFDTSMPSTWQSFKDQKVDLILGSFLCVLGGVFALTGPSGIATLGVLLVGIHCLRVKHEGGDASITFYYGVSLALSLAWVRLDVLFGLSYHREDVFARMPIPHGDGEAKAERRTDVRSKERSKFRTRKRT